MPDIPRSYAARSDEEKPTAFVRLSHAIAELRAAMGHIGIDHAQVCVGIVEHSDNRDRLVEALPMALRPSMNRQQSEVVELDGIGIHMMRPRVSPTNAADAGEQQAAIALGIAGTPAAA